MRIGRTLPPAAAPITIKDILSGIKGALKKDQAVERFRSQLKAYFQVRHCYLLSSGKAALTMILQALKKIHPEKDEVLIPAFTCYSVPSAIVRAGLKVGLCDIDPQTLDFDYEQLPSRLSDQRLLCVLLTHLFGLPADVGRVKKLLESQPMTIVEDAAQALGASHNGSKLGTMGDVGFFSLGRGKALSTIEGGIIITNDDRLAAVLDELVDRVPHYKWWETAVLFLYAVALLIFLHPLLFWIPKAMPFLKLGETVFDPDFKIRRMGGFQAGLAREWQTKIEKLQARRGASARYWEKKLPATVATPLSMFSGHPAVIRFPVQAGSAMQALELTNQGERMGLGISATYPAAIHEVAQVRRRFRLHDFPAASAAARQLVTLPVHGFVNYRDRKKIMKLLSLVR